MTFLDQWIERGRPDEKCLGCVGKPNADDCTAETCCIHVQGHREHDRAEVLAYRESLRRSCCFSVAGDGPHTDGCQDGPSQPCNACDAVDYAGELDEAGRCAECAAL